MNSNSLSGITSITASGDITGNIRSFNTLAITRAGSTWKPLTPTSRGVYLGLDSAITGGIEIVTDSGGNQYVDFSTVNSDYKRQNFI